MRNYGCKFFPSVDLTFDPTSGLSWIIKDKVVLGLRNPFQSHTSATCALFSGDNHHDNGLFDYFVLKRFKQNKYKKCLELHDIYCCFWTLYVFFMILLKSTLRDHRWRSRMRSILDYTSLFYGARTGTA